ncbi:MAG: M36 family metallopeptidase [Luteolibacter sp.]
MIVVSAFVSWWVVAHLDQKEAPPAAQVHAAEPQKPPPAIVNPPPQEQDHLPNTDARLAKEAPPNPQPQREAALAELRLSVPGVQVEFDEVSGGPKSIMAVGKFLSPPLAGQNADPHEPVARFVDAHHTLFGHESAALKPGKSRVSREDTSAHNGMRTVVWQQELDGIPFFQTILRANLTKNGELISIGGNYLSDPEKAAEGSAAKRKELIEKPPVSATKAVSLAAQNIGTRLNESSVSATKGAQGVERKQSFTAPLISDTSASLTWVPMTQDSAELAWDVTIMSTRLGEMFRVLVDVENGEVLTRHSLTDYISNATYRVYARNSNKQPYDSPTPFSPGHATPLTSQPAEVASELVTIDALDTTASPNGWINDGLTETLGNNVDAHTDFDATPNSPDLPRPTSATRNFDFPVNFAAAPNAYKNAAVTNLFYLSNWIHDRMYELGFTESAGNFQNNNFGRGGSGNDALQADAQDGSGTNNANFSTPSDGSPGRMQMYIFTGPMPDVDGDLDSEIVIHEYTHGLSNRLVGGGVGISANQTQGMGEGWSDFYAMSLLSESGDNVNGNYAAGGYATRQFSSLTQNYYYGIRRYPYSTDLTKNPLTFKDIDPSQASSHPGIPRSPIIGNTANEVHNEGEVWCVILWDLRANLITQRGYAVGNQMALQLVTDAMKLCPTNPNFLQSRDAIIQADLVDNAGANSDSIWAAFAKRGLGAGATSPSSSSSIGVVESYNIPDNLGIAPYGGFVATGQTGGAITPGAQIFTLNNSGVSNLNWTASKSQAWLTLSSSGGTLAPGVSTTLTATFNPATHSLVPGSYADTIIFTNSASGATLPRSVDLTIEPQYTPVFWEPFETGTLASAWTITGTGTHRTLVTTANAPHAGVYHLAMDSSVNDSYSRNEATLTLDLAGRSNLSLSFWVKMFNDEANAPATNPFTTGADFDGVAISNDGGNTWYEIQDLRSISNTWQKIQLDLDAALAARGLSYTSNFKIRFNHYDNFTISTDGFAFDDILVAQAFTNSLAITAPDSATEGDAPVTATLFITPPPASDTLITLSSSTAEATVPSTVTVQAGTESVNFLISPTDDGILDGSQTSVLTASAPPFANVSKTFTVHDNEMASLAIDVPDSAFEGSSPLTGVITVSTPVEDAVSVTLSSDSPSVTVPSNVTIPAGSSTAQFSLALPNDHQINGSRTVAISAIVAGWTAGNDSITILDDEASILSVGLPALREGDIGKTGNITISGTLATDLTINLACSDTTEMTVPATVTIPAGQTIASVPLAVINDAETDGSQPVTLTAIANGFPQASAIGSVDDNDAHHFTITPIPGSILRNSPVAVSVTAKDVNDAIITNFSGLMSFTAQDISQTPATLTPNSSNAFVNGVLSTQLTFTSYGNGVSLTVMDPSGHSGTSNPFDVTSGPLDHFIWSPIAHPQYIDAPFQATLRASDVAGNPVSSYAGHPALNAIASDTVEILSWTAYSDNSAAGEYVQTKQAISNHFTNFHETSTTTSDATTLAGLLVGKNVFLIVEQEDGSSSTLAALGTAWAAVLNNFVNSGGTVIACSNTNYEHLLLTNSGLLDVTPVGSPTSITVIKSLQTPVNANVPVPFTGSYLHTYTTTNGTVDLQTVANEPVVISRTIGAGRVVMIGTDFYTTGTGMDRALANAVSLATQSSPVTLPVSPVITGNFIEGEWTGSISIPFSATSVKLRATDSPKTADSNSFPVNSVQLDTPLGSGISLSLPSQVTEGDGVVNGTVNLTPVIPASSDIVVNLASKSPAKITVPTTVTILAGESSATVPINILDDPFIDGRKSVIITASSIGNPEVQSAVQVIDNDGGNLQLTVPATTQENSGSVAGTVTLSTPALAAQVISLASDLPTAAQVPVSIVISRGAISGLFSITIPDDGIVDGDQTAHLSATLPGWTNAESDLLVQDNESRNLTVAVPPVMRETDTPKTGTVTLGGNAAADLMISLSSSNTAEVTVPASVIIPMGQSSVSFAVTVHDDPIADGPQAFTVTASAASFISGEASGTVRDNEAHHFTFAAIGSPELKKGPVPAVITARDSQGAIMTEFNSPITLSATSDSGALAVSPGIGGAFLNGVWSGSIQINAVASNVILNVSDGNGHTGSSNSFDLIDGAIARFEWDPIPSQQMLDTDFTATIRAVDDDGVTVTGYNGIANLFVLASSLHGTIDSGNTPFAYGINTYSHDSRSNSLYTAAELGGTSRISALSFNITSVPSAGETLTNWTIRLKHTSQTSLAGVTNWDNTGWTTVYRASPAISASGWVTFNFTTPFDYDGTSNLIVDCSMDRNTSAGIYTYVQSTTTSNVLSISGASNSTNGDPLTWSGSTPGVNASYQRPNLRISTIEELPIRPSRSGSFSNGVWTGQISIPVAQNGLATKAVAGTITGTSNSFDVSNAPLSSGSGAIVFAEDFESGSLNPAWWTSTGTGTFRTMVTSSYSPHGGVNHMTMDSTSTIARNEATLTVNLTGRTGAVLKFWAAGYNDEPNGPPASPFIGGADFDGVAISADGTTWWEVQGLRSLPSTYGQFSVDLDAAVAAVGINYGSDFKIRFNQYDDFPLTTDGIVIDDILITANPLSGFAFDVPKQVSEADGSANASVSLDSVAATDTIIYLSSSAPAKITVPASVTVPAGQISASFDLTIIDDGIADGNRMIAITGASQGNTARSVQVMVADDEILPFSLTVPTTAIEGAGGQTGTLTLGAPASGIITIDLSSSDTTELTVPATVVFQPGQTVVTFPIAVVDDAQIDGTQSATITASVPRWRDATADMLVTDNENHNLTLSGPYSGYEGTTSTGTVSLSGTLPTALTITLNSSNPAQFSVPATLTIPAGQTSVTFAATVVDDAATDGTQLVTISASSPTFTIASTTAYAYDNDVHHFGISTIASPQKSGVPFSMTVSARDINNSVITVSSAVVTLSASGNNGTMAVTPAGNITLSSGSWTGNASCAAADANVRITAAGGGVSGISNSFEVQLSPAIAINPTGIAITLNQGQSTTRNLTITNTGGGSLIWNITTSSSLSEIVSNGPAYEKAAASTVDKTESPLATDPSTIHTESRAPGVASEALANLTLQSALNNLNLNNSLVRSAIPNRYAFTEGVTGTSITDGGGDMYDGGNYLGSNIGSYLNYSENVIVNSALLGTGGQYFTRKLDGLWVFAADVNGLSYFEITGNLGADGGGSTDSAILSVVRDGVTYRGFVKRVYGTTDPSVNHLIITTDNGNVTHEVSTDTNNDYHRVTGLTGVTRIYHLVYAGTSGTYIGNTAALNIMNTFLDTISAPDWVSPSPSSGSVSAGISQNVTLAIDATNLTQGIYNRNLVVTSNDPSSSFPSVPLTLTVTGGANLSVSPASSLASTGPRGGPFTPTSQTYTLSNSGGQPLTWAVSKTSTWLTLSSNGGSLNPGASTSVTASLNTGVNTLPSGAFNETVTFTNTTNGLGDVTRPIALTVTPFGELSVTPALALDASGPFGGPFLPDNRIYTLTNTNNTPLN